MSVLKTEWARLQAEWPVELGDWNIEVSARLISSGGMCYTKEKVIRIAEWMVLRAPDAEIIDTIRHEAAHALTPGHGHDALWKFTCELLGARPSRCYESSLNHLTAAQRPRRSWR